MEPDQGVVYRFGDVEIDPARGSILRDGSRVYLRQQTLQVLQYLLAHRHRLITKQELFDAIWGGTAVTDDAVVQCVVQIRKAVGDDARTPRFVRTVPRIGYEVVAPLEEVRRMGPPDAAPAAVLTPAAVTADDEPAEAPTATPTRETGGVDRRRPLSKVALAAAVVVLGGLLWYGVGRIPRAGEPAPSLADKPGVTRIAVATFEDHSGGGDLEWLRRGLPDMIVSGLGQYEHVAVLGREQLDLLFARAGLARDETLRLVRALAIAKRANAQLLITGSYTVSGPSIRVDARLHDVATGNLIAADSIVATDRSGILGETDILTVRIARRLGIAVAGARSRRNLVDVSTDNLEAYRWYVQGLDKSRALEPADAIAAFQKAVEADPQFAMAYGRIGYAYAFVHWDPDRARPYLEKAFQLSGRLTDRDRANLAAWYSVAHREYGEAIHAYQRIIDRYPDDIEAHWRLGVLLEGEEQFDEAVAALERGRAIDPDYAEFYNSLGSVYVKTRRPQEAVAAYFRLVELSPSVANAYDSLGLGYQAAGDYAKAVAAFERAIALSPGFEVALIHLGNVHFMAGHYRKALALYDRYIAAAEYDNDRSRGYGYRAWVEFHRGNRAAAWRDAQRSIALSLRPIEPIRIAVQYGRPHARDWVLRVLAAGSYGRGGRGPLRLMHLLQGDAALIRGDEEAALAHYARAAAAAPVVYHLEWYEEVLADGYVSAGKDDLALKEYERVLRLHPHLAHVRFKFAQTLDRTDQHQRAREEYARFLEQWRDADADIPDIATARQRLATLAAAR